MRYHEIMTEVGKKSAKLDAWHGSPHRIEMFSTTHIGSGEGNQAYGWGLYFASTPATAQYYHDALTTECTYRGKKVPSNNPRVASKEPPEVYAIQSVAGELNRPNVDSKEVNGIIAKQIEDTNYTIEWMTESKDSRLAFQQAVLKTLRRLNPADFKTVRGRTAHMYHVSLPNGPFLDWDKPFRQQDRAVKIALRKMTGKYHSYLPSNIKDNDTGEVIYKGLYTFNFYTVRVPYDEREKASSLDLLKAGIRGIRYADAGTRDAELNTYNYVIFDGHDVTIKSVERAMESTTAINGVQPMAAKS
jgi:hypothetical protein